MHKNCFLRNNYSGGILLPQNHIPCKLSGIGKSHPNFTKTNIQISINRRFIISLSSGFNGILSKLISGRFLIPLIPSSSVSISNIGSPSTSVNVDTTNTNSPTITQTQTQTNTATNTNNDNDSITQTNTQTVSVTNTNSGTSCTCNCSNNSCTCTCT